MYSISLAQDISQTQLPKIMPTFESLVALFIQSKDIRRSSLRVYEVSFAQFHAYLQSVGSAYPREQDVKSFKQHLIDKQLSPFTISAYIAALKSLFSFLANRNLYPNIAREINVPKKPKGFMKDSLTKKQAQDLLSAAQGPDVTSKRDYAILSTLVRCGLRSIELIRANIEDIRQSSGIPVLYVQGKGCDAKDEFVVLTEGALSALNLYLAARGKLKPSDPLFASHGPRNNDGRLTTRSISRLVKQYMAKINLTSDRLTCHSLRHTFATLALMNNAPLLALQEAMRHANINTTTMYTHMQDRLTKGAEYFIDL